MKIRSILSLLTTTCMVACNDGSVFSVGDIAGNYEGYILSSCAYFQNNCTTGEAISISENTDGTATVSFVSDSWGEFSIPNARMGETDGAYSLSGDGKAQMGMEGNITSYDCSFTAVIHSKEKAQMRFEVPAVMGGFSVVFSTGEAPLDYLMAGTYKGYSDADCAYFQNRYTDDESLTMKANGDGTLSMEFESASWGRFSIASVSVLQEGEIYSFAGNGSVSMGMGESVSEYGFSMTGSSNGAKDSYSITFSIPSVMGGLSITLLPGKAPTAVE